MTRQEALRSMPVLGMLLAVITAIVFMTPTAAAFMAQTAEPVAKGSAENSHSPLSSQWWIQLGFIGAFCVSMYVTFWLIKARRVDWQTWMKELLQLNRETNEVLRQNTAAFVKINQTLGSLCEKLAVEETAARQVYQAMLGRPCLTHGRPGIELPVPTELAGNE